MSTSTWSNRAIADGRQAAADGRLAEAAELFQQARHRFRGEALGELEDDPACAGLRRQLAELELTVEEERLVNELDRGNHRSVIGELETLVGRDPTRERAWCLLVTALRRLRTASRRLGFRGPSQTCPCARTGDRTRPAAPRARTSRPQPSTSPRCRGPPSPCRRSALDQHGPCHLERHGLATGRLPAWDTRFCGRSDEIPWLVGRVPEARVVVLTGPGGIGKTRLAAVRRPEAGRGVRRRCVLRRARRHRRRRHRLRDRRRCRGPPRTAPVAAGQPDRLAGRTPRCCWCWTTARRSSTRSGVQSRFWSPAARACTCW